MEISYLAKMLPRLGSIPCLGNEATLSTLCVKKKEKASVMSCIVKVILCVKEGENLLSPEGIHV